MRNILYFVKYILFDGLNILCTLRINIKAFRCKFYKFPILIFGNCEMRLNGNIYVDNLSFGLVRLGYRGMGIQSLKGQKSQLLVDGILRISPKSYLFFVPGYRIHILNTGVLTLSDGYFGANTLIQTFQCIKIGYSVSSSWNCEYIDSAGHYIYNLSTRSIRKCEGEIIIGDNCWIANGVSIMKGTKLANNTIVGCKSLVNEDFSSNENILIAGVPAKIVKTECRRIFRDENKIKNLMQEENLSIIQGEYL